VVQAIDALEAIRAKLPAHAHHRPCIIDPDLVRGAASGPL